MAQLEIIKYLTKSGNKPINLSDLSKVLGINRTNVARACRQLKKSNEIKVKAKKEKSYVRFIIQLK